MSDRVIFCQIERSRNQRKLYRKQVFSQNAELIFFKILLIGIHTGKTFGF